jgi:hypothetical protein
LLEHGFTAKVTTAVKAIRSKEVSRLTKDARPRVKPPGPSAALGSQEAVASDGQNLQAQRLDQPRHQMPSPASTSQQKTHPNGNQAKSGLVAHAASATAAAAGAASRARSRSSTEVTRVTNCTPRPSGSAAAASGKGEGGEGWRELDEVEQTDLQARLRFLVPCSRQVFGVPDPSETLEYGTVFFQPTIDGEPTALKGFAFVVS